MKIKLIMAALAATCCMPAMAQTLDFEDIGTPNGITGYNTGFTDQGFAFSSNSDVVDVSPGAPWQYQGPAYSGRYIVLNDFGGSTVMTKVGGGVFDLDSFFVKTWYGSTGVDAVTAYLGGNLVGSLGYSVSGDWSKVSLGLTGIDTLVFNTGANILEFDNVALSGTPGVPEPASWAMMLGGFGLVGGAMRSRKRMSAVSFG